MKTKKTKKTKRRCEAKLAQKRDTRCSSWAREGHATCWNHRNLARLTPRDPREVGSRTLWGWPRRDPLKSEPMGAANKHCFPDLSQRSLCGRWRAGTEFAKAQVDTKGACSKCEELQIKSIAGTWTPPLRRK